MTKTAYYLHWRTAPRSVYVLLNWLPIFYRYHTVNNLLVAISKVTKKLDNYKLWTDETRKIINQWKEAKGKYTLC